jgi:hypothetical protein
MRSNPIGRASTLGRLGTFSGLALYCVLTSAYFAGVLDLRDSAPGHVRWGLTSARESIPSPSLAGDTSPQFLVYLADAPERAAAVLESSAWEASSVQVIVTGTPDGDATLAAIEENRQLAAEAGYQANVVLIDRRGF